ncbi:MAG: caspase family protein [Candidatus Phosphoribacter sp.]
MGDSDRALVVGCDAYPNAPGAELSGAVADALAIRRWLVDPYGPGLEPAQITFLASPSGSGQQPDPELVTGPATRLRLAQAVAALREVRGGERLYVYFAGHGCRTDPQNQLTAQDALALTDFSAADPAASCTGVEDLRIRLSLCDFRDVVMIIDACRNLPFQAPFRLSSLGLDPTGPPSKQARVFLLQSTAAGESAVELESDAGARGVFSAALSDSLAGAGAAKVFDDTDETSPYLVRWSSVCAHLAATVQGQTPSYLGQGDLVLGRFPDGSFEDVRLDIDVAPTAAPGELTARVRYPLSVAGDEKEVLLSGGAPWSVLVPPRRVRVRLTAVGLAGGRPVDVYTPTAVTIELAPQVPNTPERGPRRGRVTRGLARNITAQIDIADPAAVIEIRRLDGRLVERGVSGWSGELMPAAYEVVVVGCSDRKTTLDASEDVTLLLESAIPSRARLPWATDAALAALNASEHLGVLRSGRCVLVVVGPDGQVGVEVIEAGRATVAVGTATLEVPALAGVVTAVTSTAGAVSVALFDVAVLPDEVALTLLDRAQTLRRCGRNDASMALLDALDRRLPGSVVAEVLRGSHADAPALLADLVPFRDAPRLLRTGPWASLHTT